MNLAEFRKLWENKERTTNSTLAIECDNACEELIPKLLAFVEKTFELMDFDHSKPFREAQMLAAEIQKARAALEEHK